MNFKHMLFRAASALLLVSGLGFAGCDDADPDAFLSVTRQEIEVEYTGLTTEGEMVNFDLGTNRSWRASYVEEWIHLTHTEGDRGRVRIFLSIDENNTGEDRTGFIIFEGDGGTRRTIAVTQKLKVDALSVTPAKITVVKSGLLETGEKAAIFISTNCDWEISVADDSKWITPVKTSGAPGDESIDLDIAQNTTDGVRTGTFTVTADSKTATVTVTQNLEGLKVSVSSFLVNKFGFSDEDRTPLTFTVTAAEAWTAQSDGWLTPSPASGDAGQTEVTLTVGENTTGAPRNGEVKILTSLTGLETVVRVAQNAKNSLFDDDGKEVRLCLLRRAVRLDFEVQRCRLRGRTYAEGSGQYLHGGEQGSIRSRQSVFRCRTDRFQSRFTDDLRLLGLSQNGCRRQADRNHPAGSCDSRGAGH